jgi:hypothetical protein
MQEKEGVEDGTTALEKGTRRKQGVLLSWGNKNENEIWTVKQKEL